MKLRCQFAKSAVIGTGANGSTAAPCHPRPALPRHPARKPVRAHLLRGWRLSAVPRAARGGGGQGGQRDLQTI